MYSRLNGYGENIFQRILLTRRGFPGDRHVADDRVRGTRRGDRRHRESLRVPRPVRRPKGVQQPVAAELVRRGQHGVRDQRAADRAGLGVANVVFVRRRTRRAVHTGGGQHSEPDDAVDRPVRVHQAPAARTAAPEQARRVPAGVRRVRRVDGGRGRVRAALRVARPPAAAGRRHAVDALLRGVLRGRRVRRAVGRGGVLPAGRQPHAVRDVAQGGRGPRTAAAAHADHDGRVQAGHPGGVHTEQERGCRTVQGDERHRASSTATAALVHTATTATAATRAAASSTTKNGSDAERPESETVGQSAGRSGRRVLRLLATVRHRVNLHQLVLAEASRRGQRPACTPAGDRGRAVAGPRPLGRQPGRVLVAEPAHVASVPVVSVVRRRSVRRRRRRRRHRRRVRLRRRAGVRLRRRRVQFQRQRRRRRRRLRRQPQVRFRLPAVAQPHAHPAQPAAVPAVEQPSAQPAAVVHQRGRSRAVQPPIRHPQETAAAVAGRQEPGRVVLRVIRRHPDPFCSSSVPVPVLSLDLRALINLRISAKHTRFNQKVSGLLNKNIHIH